MFFNRKRKAGLLHFEAAARAEAICDLLTTRLGLLHAGGTLTDEELAGLKQLREALHCGWAMAEAAERLARRLPPPSMICPLRGVECTACPRPCDSGN